MRSSKIKTFPITSTFENGNLVLLIISYLNLKDFSNLLQVNKYFYKLSNHLQNKWRDGCINFFNFSIENTSISLITQTDWKKLLKKNITIHNLWNSYLSNEILDMKENIYKQLKDLNPFYRLRKQNKYIESPANSILQTYLIDMLYDEQNLYNELDNFFMKENNNFSYENQKHFPFEKLIDNIQSYITLIKENNNLKKLFIELRWYIISNNNFSLSKKILPIYIIKLLSLTLTGYCSIVVNYINDISRSNNIIYEYNLRYKNYCQMAIDLNEKYQNLSICINYLYDSIHFTKISKPKFSIIRLCMRIWNNSCLNKIKNNIITSMRLYGEEIIKTNLRELINNVPSSLNSTFSVSTDVSSQYLIYINNPLNKFNDFFYEMFSLINDTLCDEYNVYKINHSYFNDSNELVSIIENNYINSLTNQINNVIISYCNTKDPNNTNYSTLYSFIKNFIIYLKNNTYNIFSKLIPKFRMKIFESVYYIFKLHINEIILNIFLNIKNNINNDNNINNINFKSFEIYKILCDNCNNDIDKVNYFLNWYNNQNNSLIDLLNVCMKWFIEEQGKIINKNKQIEKEIIKRNLTFIDQMTEKNKILTSFSSIFTIEEIQTIDQELNK